MRDNKIFQENLERLSFSLMPQVVEKLKRYNKTAHPKKPIPEYKEDEANTWISRLQLKNINVLYIYGLGSGSFYPYVKPWLMENEEHYLVVLENDIHVLHHTLGLKIAERILSDSQTHLFFWENDKKEREELFFSDIAWFFVNLPYHITALKRKKDENIELFRKLNEKIEAYSSDAASAYQSTMLCGESFYINYYSNLTSIIDASRASNLYRKFKNIPVIICGSGPSIEKQLPLLRKLQNRFLIMASGSSLAPLSINEINPHFSVFIDPTPNLQRHLKNHLAFETPSLYRNRVFHQTIKNHHGPRIHINGSGRYFISDWFERYMKIEDHEHISEGISVSTFSISIAAALGCSTIILLGMDLAYTNGREYASGIEKNNASFSKEKQIDIIDIFGNLNKTKADWIRESIWISNFSHVHPEISFINASEGGIGFEGIENITLKETSKRFSPFQYDLRNRIHTEISQSFFERPSKENIFQFMREVKKSLLKCLNLCRKMLETLSESLEKLYQTKSEIEHTGKLPVTLIAEEMKREPAYQYILSPLLDYYVRTKARKEYRIKRLSARLPEMETTLSRLSIEVEKITYLEHAAESNIDYIDYALSFESKE